MSDQAANARVPNSTNMESFEAPTNSVGVIILDENSESDAVFSDLITSKFIYNQYVKVIDTKITELKFYPETEDNIAALKEELRDAKDIIIGLEIDNLGLEETTGSLEETILSMNDNCEQLTNGYVQLLNSQNPPAGTFIKVIPEDYQRYLVFESVEPNLCDGLVAVNEKKRIPDEHTFVELAKQRSLEYKTTWPTYSDFVEKLEKAKFNKIPFGGHLENLGPKPITSMHGDMMFHIRDEDKYLVWKHSGVNRGDSVSVNPIKYHRIVEEGDVLERIYDYISLNYNKKSKAFYRGYFDKFTKGADINLENVNDYLGEPPPTPEDIHIEVFVDNIPAYTNMMHEVDLDSPVYLYAKLVGEDAESWQWDLSKAIPNASTENPVTVVYDVPGVDDITVSCTYEIFNQGVSEIKTETLVLTGVIDVLRDTDDGEVDHPDEGPSGTLNKLGKRIKNMLAR